MINPNLKLKKRKILEGQGKQNLALLILGIICGLIILVNNSANNMKNLAAQNVRLYFVPTVSSVKVNETFNVYVYLSSSTVAISAVDVKLTNSANLQLLSVTPNTNSFKTFAPLDSNGVFNSDSAVASKAFAAFAFDWGTETIESGKVNNKILIATLRYRAISDGTGTVSFVFQAGHQDDSNATFADRYTVSDELGSIGSSVSIPIILCTPQCSGKVCGRDGCGGTCGTCSAGQLCYQGQCKAVTIRQTPPPNRPRSPLPKDGHR